MAAVLLATAVDLAGSNWISTTEVSRYLLAVVFVGGAAWHFREAAIARRMANTALMERSPAEGEETGEEAQGETDSESTKSD